MASRATPESFWMKVDSSGGDAVCWPWLGQRVRLRSGAPGYGRVGYQGRVTMAHRLAWELTYGPLPADGGRGSRGTLVLHECDNPPCCNPHHLFLGTQAENVADRAAKGRSNGVSPGAANRQARLTNDQARAIREAYAAGVTGPELARQYGVATSSLYRIVHGDGYASADGPVAPRQPKVIDRLTIAKDGPLWIVTSAAGAQVCDQNLADALVTVAAAIGP